MCNFQVPKNVSFGNRETKFAFKDPEGNEISAHGYGNNVAIKCICGHPVLLTNGAGDKPGMSRAKPAVCRGAFCGAEYYVCHYDEDAKTVTIQKK